MVAEGRRRGRGQGDRRLARERSVRRQGAAGAGGMDEDGVEGVRGGGPGLDGLIHRQGAGLDVTPQQGGQVTGRLTGTGDEHRADGRVLRHQQRGQPVQIAVGGLHLLETSRPGGPGCGIADGEDGPAAVRRQGGEGRDAVGAGKGEGGDADQVGLGLRDRADGQEGGDGRLKAEGGQTGGGARGTRFGARDPDAADRRQGSTFWSPAAAWTSAPSRRPRARA